MNDTRTPYPNISDAAWTVLLRTADGQTVTTASAAAIVGPDLATQAVAELHDKHLTEEGAFSGLAMTLRRWHRQKVTP